MTRSAIAVLLLLTACTSDPVTVDLAGTWVGQYTHPSTPGSLQLNITSTDGRGRFEADPAAGLAATTRSDVVDQCQP